MNLRKLLPWRKQNTSDGEAWEVRWTSRFDDYSTSTQHEVKVFPNKEEADEFANALRSAFKLLRHTSNTQVYVRPSPGTACYCTRRDIEAGLRCDYCNSVKD